MDTVLLATTILRQKETRRNAAINCTREIKSDIERAIKISVSERAIESWKKYTFKSCSNTYQTDFNAKRYFLLILASKWNVYRMWVYWTIFTHSRISSSLHEDECGWGIFWLQFHSWNEKRWKTNFQGFHIARKFLILSSIFFYSMVKCERIHSRLKQ